MQISKELAYLLISVLLVFFYIKIWNFLNKKISNKFVKGFIVGLTTSLFVYYFLINFIYPFHFFLHTILGFPDYNSIIILLVMAYAKPISIYSGILITIIIIFKKQLLNTL